MYRLYYILSIVAFYFYALWKLPKRINIGKETEESTRQKCGIYNTPKMPEPPIWIHAASVGELVSVSALVRAIDSPVLITTVTQSSGKMFQKLGFASNVTHQYAPLDSPIYVRRFLKHFHPSIGIFIDSELWPNMIYMASKYCKLINLNARISARSYGKWRYFKSFIRSLYNKFDIIYAASLDDKRKIEKLAQRAVEFIGNLKLTVPPLECDAEELEDLKKLNRFVITFSTFHAHEMGVVSEVCNTLCAKYKDILIILAPKHIGKLGNLIKDCNNLNIVFRSKNEGITPSTNIYIADTIGEMGLWYRLASIAVVGGSFSDVEGHNIIEPAKLDNAIVIGDRFNNFKDIVELFITHDALEVAHNSTELLMKLESLYHDSARIRALSEHAKNAVECDDIINIIKSQLVLQKQ